VLAKKTFTTGEGGLAGRGGGETLGREGSFQKGGGKKEAITQKKKKLNSSRERGLRPHGGGKHGEGLGRSLSDWGGETPGRKNGKKNGEIKRDRTKGVHGQRGVQC